MNSVDKNELRRALMEILPIVDEHSDRLIERYNRDEISLLKVRQLFMRRGILKDVIEHWCHYDVHAALALISPIMLDLDQVLGEQRCGLGRSILDLRIRPLMRVFRKHGFVGLHHTHRIPIQIH